MSRIDVPAAVDPRIVRRRRSIARARRHRVAVGSASAATLAAIVWVLFASPLLRVQRIDLVGARHTTEDDVMAAAHLDRDPNLLTLSPGTIAAQVERLPWVERAEVERVLPGTVRVRIIERRPALVVTIGTERWTIDDDGRVLARGVVGRDLPVLGGITEEALAPGATLTSPAARDALAAWRSLPERLGDEVQAVFAPTLERITFVLRSGTQIRYGAAEHMRAKNDVLVVLLGRLAEQGRVAGYIDVRVPARPAVGSHAPAQEPAGVTPSPSPSA